jgi:hypothetical protein
MVDEVDMDGGEQAVTFWLASLRTSKFDMPFLIQSSIRNIRCMDPFLIVFITCNLLLKL